MAKYNPVTGMLVTKYADPGFYTRAWWGKDVPFDVLAGSWDEAKKALGDSKATTFVTALNFPEEWTLESMFDPPFPSKFDPDFGTLVCLWKGRFEIIQTGNYNFTLKSNANGAFMNISGTMVLMNSDGEDVVLENEKMASGFHRVEILWKAPAWNSTTGVLSEAGEISLEYSGPDTDGYSTPLAGVHFPHEMDEPVKKAAKDMVKKGFGITEYRLKEPFLPFADTNSGLPSQSDLLNKGLLSVDVGARVRTLDMANHEEFVAKLKDRTFPTNAVILQARGLIKIETRGLYNFTLESDDGSKLFVDNKVVADTRLDEQGELPHNNSVSGEVYLQHGWHTARIVWFQNSTDNDAGYAGKVFPKGEAAAGAKDADRPRDSQVLRLLYSGPDTGGDSQLVKGFYLKGVASSGSLRGIKMSDGDEEDEGSDFKEKNWASNFDQEWLSANKDKPWKKLDDADLKKEIYDPAAKIISPYVSYDEAANDHQHASIPDELYDHQAYDHEVVDLGGKGIGWKHAEADGSYIYSVMGKPADWSDNWEKTPNSAADYSGR